MALERIIRFCASIIVFGLVCTIARADTGVSTDSSKIEINGATFDYVERGSGEPMVLVHGHISDRRAWSQLIDELSRDFRVFAYTQRYYGNEKWHDNGEKFKRSTHINDLVSFVERLKLAPVHLVTRSYGGYVGIHAMSKRPELFRSAVHFEPAIADHIQSIPGYMHAWRELTNEMGPISLALEEKDEAAAALRFLEVVYRLPSNSATSHFPAQVIEMIEENGRTVAPYFKMKSINPLGCDQLSLLNVPQLIVQGEDTHVWFAMAAESLVSCLPNAELATMSGVNHDGIVRKPNEFLRLIRNFPR